MRAQALFHVAPRRVECKEVALRAPSAGEVSIAGLCSAISAGTETMIYTGAFPHNAALDLSIASLQGVFAYPFSYGYALVGKVTDIGPGVDTSWQDAIVFVFHAHQDRVVVPVAHCQRVPPGMSSEAALYLPQVETALNLVLDGAPLIGERVLVSGLGVVGLLTASLLRELPLERLVACEPLAWRRAQAQRWGIVETLDPADATERDTLAARLGEADLAFELSGDPSALNLTIESMGFDGRIVVGSWYGTQAARMDLGGRFHRNRLRIISSQVSTLAPALSGRWDKARRLAMAWRMLERLRPERLPTRYFPLARCQEAFETLCARPDGVMQVGFRYR